MDFKISWIWRFSLVLNRAVHSLIRIYKLSANLGSSQAHDSCGSVGLHTNPFCIPAAPFSELQIPIHIHSCLGISCLDFCLRHYIGISLKANWKPHLAQNAAVQLVIGTSQFAHIILSYHKFHGLLVGFQIHFKALIIIHKAFLWQGLVIWRTTCLQSFLSVQLYLIELASLLLGQW